MQPNLAYLTTKPPVWLAIAFALITALTLLGFLVAVRKATSKHTVTILVGLLSWVILLGLLASQDFFLALNVMPPRFPLAVVPPILVIISLFVSPGGRQFLDAFPLSTLTYLNVIRVPVELVLYGLYVHHQIPELMTFEGRNFDILAGLTAPVIAYFAFHRHVVSNRWLLVWNVISLLLLTNIVTNAILSAPLPFQQLAFEQPNVAILKFPFVWLPGFVVPVVLLGHLVSIRRLTASKSQLS
jgi:hypothetical protein